MQSEEIHTAYAMSRKGGTHYRCRAFVLRETGAGTIKHSRVVALGDTPEEAQDDCLRYIARLCEIDNVPLPETVIHHGKMAAVFVDNLTFPL